MNNNKQIETYKNFNRELKEHEKELLHLLTLKNILFKGGDVLDIGCADGLFSSVLAESFQNVRVDALERNEELCSQAVQRKNINVIKGDCQEFVPLKKYDLIIASGILSVFKDPISVMFKWLTWLKEGGKCIVFTIFNAQPMDFYIEYKNLRNDQGWESGFTCYSMESIKKSLHANGYDCEFIPFNLSTELHKTEDPIKSYTLNTSEGKKIIVADTIVNNFYYLFINEKE